MSNCRPCLFTSRDVQVVSCAADDPVVVDVLTSIDVPGVASSPDVVTPNTADDVPSAIGVPITSGVTIVVGIPAVVAAVGNPAVAVVSGINKKETTRINFKNNVM